MTPGDLGHIRPFLEALLYDPRLRRRRPSTVAIRQGNDIKALDLACPLTPVSFETGFEITTYRHLANARLTTYQIAKS
uniref:Uncharacterized protein n=1 Tax=Sphingomonas sp. JE1 TaxID=1628059 RepID=A0A0D5A073_9SPHN|nr:hypothetical protein pJE1_139 [Sphingomonas sp. JE1]